MTLLWAYLLGLPPTSIETYRSRSAKEPTVRILTTLIHFAFYLSMVGWHVLEAFVPPPENKPDLWVVLNALIGASGFALAYLWSVGYLVGQAWTIGTGPSADAAKKIQ
jgi:alpha-1,3-glucosyltransferase